MGFIVGFLGACIGIIVGLAIIIRIIYIKVKKTVGTQNMKEIVNVAKNAKNIQQQEYQRKKNVAGITKLIETTILRDFKDFNKEFLYSKVEKNLSKIWNAIENKSISDIKNDNDLIYLYHSINEKIIDLQNSNYNIKYDDIVFHSHAIKNYLKTQGKATLTISSTVEYFYSNDSDDYNKKEYNNLKKQTRYTTEFVYIYDETKFKYNQKAFVISCPNCGAPLRKFGEGNCEYCGTFIKPINLKNWYMISYKEDYE